MGLYTVGTVLEGGLVPWFGAGATVCKQTRPSRALLNETLAAGFFGVDFQGAQGLQSVAILQGLRGCGFSAPNGRFRAISSYSV